MPQTCPVCSRLNPDTAAFCFLDGSPLPGHALNGGPGVMRGQRFPAPFVFPSGRVCNNFDELALACQQNWTEARQLLQKGYLENFLSSLGRADLALAAREAANFPDPDRGVDQFLAKLPSTALEVPKLRVEPLEINLGQLRVGDEHSFDLHLRNQGMRLVYGSIVCDQCPWLAVGAAPGAAQKVFEFGGETVIAVRVRGKRLWASSKPLEGRLLIESNGGSVTVLVRAEIPAKPFPDAPLAGACTPRQVAERARDNPSEAAPLFENGAVARWYQDNGWQYPVRLPSASGLGALQQFFEALGLTPSPRVTISERSVALHGNVGEQLTHKLEVKARQKRPVYAHATSDQPWLEVSPPRLKGRTATIPLTVPAVPNRAGEVLQARLTVISNGNQTFVVPVTLAVDNTVRAARLEPLLVAEIVEEPILDVLPVAEVKAAPALPPSKAPLVRPASGPAGAAGATKAAVPASLLVLALVVVLLRDAIVLLHSDLPRGGLVDARPRIAVRLHDHLLADDLSIGLSDPTLRFGLVMLQEKDPRKQGRLKRLTYDEWGRSNNTCLRVDGSERLFGARSGRWEERDVPRWQDDQGRGHDGARSVWLWEEQKIRVTQFVEVVPGEQTGLLDTCLVRYALENQDRVAHHVGLRFLLDTYIGANDGVPFTIPGAKRLCDTSVEFDGPLAVPDFIEALENDDLAHPGTVAHLKLKLGDREPPSRVTLGAWPDRDLRSQGYPGANGQNTLWQVPVASMKTLQPFDSAVAIYWGERLLPPGGKREVGFAYGLGSFASSDKLLVTLDGSFKPGGAFTVTALVKGAVPGEALTLSVPDGFTIEGTAVQKVPESGGGHNRPVTWKVRAGGVGEHAIAVRSSTGAEQRKVVRIKESSIFD